MTAHLSDWGFVFTNGVNTAPLDTTVQFHLAVASNLPFRRIWVFADSNDNGSYRSAVLQGYLNNDLLFELPVMGQLLLTSFFNLFDNSSIGGFPMDARYQ